MTILSYPFAFARVISQLAENVKGHAYPQKYEMDILTSPFICESGSVFIYFKDFGVEIGKKELKKIFNPFYTTHMGRGNSGLGSSVCFNTFTHI